MAKHVERPRHRDSNPNPLRRRVEGIVIVCFSALVSSLADLASPTNPPLLLAPQTIDGGLESLNVPYSYGYAILCLTLLVKVVTFPLTKKQVEGSIQMQAIQPRVKELQAMYANDPERLQMETARLYKEANFNPLAGCLPTFATLPVFIGLYRALSNAAAEGLLTDGFYWIPSLGGPASIASRNDGTGFAWLTDFSSGAPPLGWHDTIAYLVLPVLLVVSQSASQKIMTPETQSTDPSQQQTQAILKFLPLMIGFFSLNVPAGLTLYWFANNILSTAQTVYLRKTTKAEPLPAGAGAGGMPMPGTPGGRERVGAARASGVRAQVAAKGAAGRGARAQTPAAEGGAHAGLARGRVRRFRRRAGQGDGGGRGDRRRGGGGDRRSGEPQKGE